MLMSPMEWWSLPKMNRLNLIAKWQSVIQDQGSYCMFIDLVYPPQMSWCTEGPWCTERIYSALRWNIARSFSSQIRWWCKGRQRWTLLQRENSLKYCFGLGLLLGYGEDTLGDREEQMCSSSSKNHISLYMLQKKTLCVLSRVQKAKSCYAPNCMNYQGCLPSS